MPIIPDRSATTAPHAFSRDPYRLRNRVETPERVLAYLADLEPFEDR